MSPGPVSIRRRRLRPVVRYHHVQRRQLSGGHGDQVTPDLTIRVRVSRDLLVVSRFVGSFDEFPHLESGAGTDQSDEVGLGG
jgi:hypothetical protein